VERKELTTICVMIPQTMRDLIEQVVSKDTHNSLSEFVRDAIRQKLQKDASHLYEELFRETKK